jgi:extracellular factor (EF) 3-hydroxypalmitic acid methyl ester biosynthesis protein
MYDPVRQGASVFARILHQLGREERLSATVPKRKELLVRHIQEAVARGRSHQEVSVASVGAGPAREIEDYLRHHSVGSRTAFILIDQDEHALRYADEQIRKVAVRHGDLVTVKCRYASFKQMISEPELLQELRGHDLIYSAGLFDYLSEPVGRELTSRLFELLREGGWVLFGNAAESWEARWVPEFILDWRMFYRTEQDMREFALDLGDSAKVEVERDPSGAWSFLVARKV